MGKRIATLRKEHGFTQVQLAEAIGVSQQTLAHYEVGRLRMAVSTLQTLCQTLDVSIDELVNEPKKPSKNKRGPTPKLQQQLEQISQLPRTKQKFISEMLDALIQQQQSA
ncbi:hypothetical protein GCM10007877_40130 [Marinibactrum halimedae]|uniref:HTH cro/C1-type domain-containing protein n=2 Tax=Marinibactrum halimedae TaxID=1444977 RepID=A0AA37WPB6_9GAMM|nr:hypothetical protein GCM10007877_40130 [Marinibactrum halimedae]